MKWDWLFGENWHPKTAKHSEEDLRVERMRAAEDLTDPDVVETSKKITARWRNVEHTQALAQGMNQWHDEAAREHLERTREFHKVQRIRS